ncbi:MAG: hypothetical protein QOJ40_2808 [Verrucomicrobiota bacterium]
MTTNIGQRGQIVLPKAIRTSRRIQPGDDFEVTADEDDFDLILLRRIRPAANAGLVDHLAACPHKGTLSTPVRRAEAMRKVSL